MITMIINIITVYTQYWYILYKNTHTLPQYYNVIVCLCYTILYHCPPDNTNTSNTTNTNNNTNNSNSNNSNENDTNN